VAGIFKKNDIRGKFDIDLSLEIIEKIGYSFAVILGPGKRIVLAGDSRLSTPQVKIAISRGLVKGGSIVYDIGLGPSPMVYFISRIEEEISAGIMITASHNPPDHNGIKICNGLGETFHFDNLYNRIEESIPRISQLDEIDVIKGGGVLPKIDLANKYFNYLKDQFSFSSKLKIAIEYGNGASGRFSEVLKKLGCSVYSIRDEMDGNFPSLVPDPVKEYTYQKLREALENDEYDILLAFDVDGDRIGFMTPMKEIISPDKIIMLFAKELLDRTGSAKILIDVKISKASIDYITQIGGQVSLTQVGHSWVHENLKKSGSHIAGELSCHYYFQDKYFGFDDGLYAALRMIDIINKIKSAGKSFQDEVNQLPSYSSTPEYRDAIPNTTQEIILSRLEEFTKEKGGRIINIDGVRGEFENSWFIARKSGTEEALSYRIEGKTDVDLENLKTKILKIIKES
jgi:phosphomannomutase/phosphoglucomutase